MRSLFSRKAKTLEEIENGISIEHEWLGRKQIIEVTFDEAERRLTLKVDGKEVCLNEGETGYFLVFAQSWYNSLTQDMEQKY